MDSTLTALFLLTLVKGTTSYASLDVNDTSPYCVWKNGIFSPDDFNLNACAWCYFYLFPANGLFPNIQYLQIIGNGSVFPKDTMLLADINNSTSKSHICSTLSDEDCNRWKLCCDAANTCCRRNVKTARSDVITASCRSTWDGYNCWDGGTPGTNSYASCPSFLMYSIPTRMAVKSCLSNDTWLKRNGREWTDYTPCLTYMDLRVTLYISLGCQVASLVVLLPSLVIFFGYKFLRKQHRIRLHINFFISFTMSNLFNILWSVLVTHDKITNSNLTDTLMHKNLVTCKMLSFLKIYFTGTNYAWMFCEGFYLYRLIVNAFSPPKRLLLLYIAGWGVPLVFCIVYGIMRLTSADESCWAISMGNKEWIIYTPNLACLLVNVFFLCSILRILLTQLQAHPNEPSNFRRALKATFVLIPLFGVQLAVTIYRPPPNSSIALYYERFSEVVKSSQGFVVALIFCFFNGEVSTQIKRSWKGFFAERTSGGSRRFNTTLSLHFNHSVSQRSMDHGGLSRRDSLEPCLDKLRSTNTSLSTTQSQLL